MYIELIIIGLIIPSIILINRLADNILLILWAITSYTLIVYIFFHKKEKFREVLNFSSFTTNNLIIIFVRWFFLSLLIFIITFYFYNDKLFIIQKENPYLLFIIFFIYPFLSALPQEFIFTTFLFSRYKNLINQKYIIYMSAFLFMFAHVLFINFIAPFLSIFGGIIFARTYMKTKSLALVTLEHALYGNTLFFMGLGYYFWGGSVN
jgi:membrane protease YdiL (CAAX protease family)